MGPACAQDERFTISVFEKPIWLPPIRPNLAGRLSPRNPPKKGKIASLSRIPFAPFFSDHEPEQTGFDSETQSPMLVVPQHGTPNQVGVVFLLAPGRADSVRQR